MLEMLLLDIFVILALLWLIADPNKPKPVLRRPKKSRSVGGPLSVSPGTPYPEPAKMTAELIPELPELRSPQLLTPSQESEPSESATATPPPPGKKSGRNQSKQVVTRPMSGEAQWGSFSTK